MKSCLTNDFIVCFTRLPERIRKLARDNYKLWMNNPHHPSLAFKRVGKNYPTYSARVGLGWRVLGFKEGNTMVWFWIGSHPEYERLIKNL